MINLKELRLGNWLQYANNDYFIKELIGTPCMVDIDIFMDAFRNPEYFNPVEISVERLVQCGFTKIGDFYTLNDVVSFTLDRRGEICLTWINIDTKFRKVIFMHDLQNLYHSLTGGLEITFTPLPSPKTK